MSAPQHWLLGEWYHWGLTVHKQSIDPQIIIKLVSKNWKIGKPNNSKFYTTEITNSYICYW